VDVEAVKRILREIATSDPAFIRDLFLDALRSDGRVIEAITELLTKNPEAKLRLAETIAGVITVPLNVATKEDIKRIEERITGVENRVTKLENKMTGLENRMISLESKVANLDNRMTSLEGRVAKLEDEFKDLKNDVRGIKRNVKDIATTLQRLTVDLEDSARDWVSYFLRQRGYSCTAERLWVNKSYEFDIYCNAGSITVVGEAKVRISANIVSNVFNRVQGLQRGWPDKVSGRLVPVIYALVVDPTAEQRARELGVWLIESRRERVTLEEVLQKT
jgi:Flagella accessory protein C (FlaC).